MKVVVKFGGSSLASADQFRKVAEIIHEDPDRRYVVPSAPGKRFDGDTKVTDMLYACYARAEADEDFSAELAAIRARYEEIIEGLGMDLSLDEEFAKIGEQFRLKAGRQYAASRGEYLNGIVLASFLGFEFVDSATVIRFNEDGSCNFKKTDVILAKRLADVEYAVIPGFYGATDNGVVTTFSRGGSDITGSIVARAVRADMYENWTDVSGFMVADPHIIKDTEIIETLTYKELRELAYMGASVLHEDAIFPVRSEGIPINIRNTNKPQDKGTLIVESTCRKPKYIITGIAGKKGFASINIEKDMMNEEIGFCRKVLQVFEENHLSFEHMPSGIDTMTVFLHQSEFQDCEQRVISGIHRAVHPDLVELESGLALLAIVGRGMRDTRGVAGKVFTALAKKNINIKMIDQGSSELNIIIGVKEKYFEDAVRVLYETFVTEA